MYRKMRRFKQKLTENECLEFSPVHMTGKIVNES